MAKKRRNKRSRLCRCRSHAKLKMAASGKSGGGTLLKGLESLRGRIAAGEFSNPLVPELYRFPSTEAADRFFKWLDAKNGR